MSRYKKIITGEVELPEIEGTKFLIYPTIETRMELLEHIKTVQIVEEVDEKNSEGKIIATKRVKGKYLDLKGIADTCKKMVFEGCFKHDGKGNRINKKDTENETTEEDILTVVLESDIMSVYLEILQVLKIMDKDKVKNIKEQTGDAEKKS